jgi:hypothetical protein
MGPVAKLLVNVMSSVPTSTRSGTQMTSRTVRFLGLSKLVMTIPMLIVWMVTLVLVLGKSLLMRRVGIPCCRRSPMRVPAYLGRSILPTLY